MITMHCRHGYSPTHEQPWMQSCPFCVSANEFPFQSNQSTVALPEKPSEEVHLLRQILEEIKIIRRELETIRMRH